jgi:hypothetical protein
MVTGFPGIQHSYHLIPEMERCVIRMHGWAPLQCGLRPGGECRPSTHKFTRSGLSMTYLPGVAPLLPVVAGRVGGRERTSRQIVPAMDWATNTYFNQTRE